MAIGANLTQGYSSGGSQNQSSSFSMTDAQTARQWSEQAATTAFNRQKELMQMEMDYNTAEALKNREWQEKMANTVYTRSAADMAKAGINPILAYSAGLGGAGTGSGAQASVSAGSAPMAQNFMDSQSASQANGSSWNSSENGLATALGALGSMLSSALGAINTGINLNMNIGNMQETLKQLSKSADNPEASKIVKAGAELGKKVKNTLGIDFNPGFNKVNNAYKRYTK